MLEFFSFLLAHVTAPAPAPIKPFIAIEFFIGDLKKWHFLETKSKTTPKPNQAPAVLKPSCMGVDIFEIGFFLFFLRTKINPA